MMMALRNFVRQGLGLGFWSRQEGAVLAEALVVVPFVTLFAAGYPRIRQHFLGADADRRRPARCRDVIWRAAVHQRRRQYRRRQYRGQPMSRHAIRRRRGRSPFTERKLLQRTLNRACRAGRTLPTSPSHRPDADGNITISTAHLYQTSPLFGWLGLDAITINSFHEERYIGW